MANPENHLSALSESECSRLLGEQDDDTAKATLTALQDTLKQWDVLRARVDTKATALLTASGLSLTVSASLMGSMILAKDPVFDQAALLPLAAHMSLALVAGISAALLALRALLVGPGNPVVDSAVLFEAGATLPVWHRNVAMHYQAIIEMMPRAISARARSVELGQRLFLAFLVSIGIFILSGLAIRLVLVHWWIPWTGATLSLVSVLATLALSRRRRPPRLTVSSTSLVPPLPPTPFHAIGDNVSAPTAPTKSIEDARPLSSSIGTEPDDN